MSKLIDLGGEKDNIYPFLSIMKVLNNPNVLTFSFVN